MKRIDVTVPAAPFHYAVLVEAGLLRDLPALLGEHAPAAAYAVIADANIAEPWAQPLHQALRDAGLGATLHIHEGGERAKTREQWARITDEVMATGMGRDGCIIAVGGGVTGDLGGFVAGTYMRGISLVQVPTTLLAMVDSSLGGKTGVDTDSGKNLVGVFHPPRLVCMDPLVLRTLPDSELRCGLAEVAKHGAIADATLLKLITRNAAALLARDPEELTAAITTSIAIKARVVAADPLEQGERASLNFGHTFAHALERIHHYYIAHGFAVAIGMMLAARTGELLGVTEAGTTASLRATLQALQLPVELPAEIDADTLLQAAKLDKKARAGRARYVLLRRVGEIARDGEGWTFEVPDEIIRAAVQAPPHTAH